MCAEGVHADLLEDGGPGELRARPPEGAAREQLEPPGAGGAGAYFIIDDILPTNLLSVLL